MGFSSTAKQRANAVQSLWWRGVRTPPLAGKGWDRSGREVLYWRWKVAMFSEWTASRAAGKRLEDVIRKQWAVPSTHNPPTWECVCLYLWVCLTWCYQWHYIPWTMKNIPYSYSQVNVLFLVPHSNSPQSTWQAMNTPFSNISKLQSRLSKGPMHCSGLTFEWALKWLFFCKS